MATVNIHTIAAYRRQGGNAGAAIEKVKLVSLRAYYTLSEQGEEALLPCKFSMGVCIVGLHDIVSSGRIAKDTSLNSDCKFCVNRLML